MTDRKNMIVGEAIGTAGQTEPTNALKWALAHVAAPVELTPEQIALVGGVNHLTIPTEVTHHTPNFLD